MTMRVEVTRRGGEAGKVKKVAPSARRNQCLISEWEMQLGNCLTGVVAPYFDAQRL